MREPFTCECDSYNNGLPSPEQEDLEATDDAMAAVMCSDGGIMNDTVEEFGIYADKLMVGAKAAGAVNVEFRMTCVGFQAQPKFRYTGRSPLLFHKHKIQPQPNVPTSQDHSKEIHHIRSST